MSHTYKDSESKSKAGRFKNSDLFDSKRAGRVYQPPTRERMDNQKKISDLLNREKEDEWF